MEAELATELRALRTVLEESTARLYTLAAAARFLGVSACRTLRPLVRSGQIRTVSLGGARVRIPRSELDRLVREGVPAPMRVKRIGPRKDKTPTLNTSELDTWLKARGF